jgi:hypothetical protein
MPAALLIIGTCAARLDPWSANAQPAPTVQVLFITAAVLWSRSRPHPGVSPMNVSAASSAHITTSMVSSKLAAAASGDGDGLTGAAALNDGDAAAHAAARSVKATQPGPAAPAPGPRAGSIDVKG